eukprot:TRINITY_DN6987_c0_g1_i4.p1 TRINITY_DN6987_c0_g1~~TRINITY_DN6987_c0_g1_i4.p1  ORF type:complete len:267 (-),score=102.72 TRINITY_DN6987_c0_g1_i4:20-820(-)
MMDFVDDDEIREMISFKTQWNGIARKKSDWKKMKKQMAASSQENVPHRTQDLDPSSLISSVIGPIGPNPVLDLVKFSTEEQEQLIRLSHKDYLIENEKPVLLGLLDLLFAYCYDFRTTMEESTVESGWTITHLSPTLSWLEEFGSVKDVLVSCIRRSLIYPLFRNYKLSRQIVTDAIEILQLGKRSILKALLKLKFQLERSEYYHHLVRLYLNDYCVWIQKVSSKKLKSLRAEVEKVFPTISKEEIGWNLKNLEKQAQEFAAEEND